MASRNTTTASRTVGRSGIGLRLLLTNLLVVVVGMTTTIVVAMMIGPPMIRKLMDRAVVPGANGSHPYERAFREATAVSVSIALAVSALATMSLSWYFSRRAHRSAKALSRAASAVADGRYDIRVASPGLGKEFDTVAGAFNKMAQQLGAIEDTRRQMLADLAHEIKTPVAVLEAYMEALEDDVQPLDDKTIATLRQQTQRLTRFSNDVTALAAAERRTTAIDARWTAPADVIGAALMAFAPLPRQGRDTHVTDRRRFAAAVGRPGTPRSGAGQPARQRPAAHPGRRPGQRDAGLQRPCGGHRHLRLR